MVVYGYTLNHPSSSLNKRLKQRYQSLLPSKKRTNAFSDLYRNMKKIIKSEFSDARLFTFGSYHAGVSLDESDLDLALFIDTEDELETAHEVARLIHSHGFQKPRVGTRKGKSTLFGNVSRFSYDMNINNLSSVLVSSIVTTAASSHFLARQLMILVKNFVTVQKLTSKNKGCLKSAAYCYLCIIVLQEVGVLPKLKETELEQLEDLLRAPPRDFPNTEFGKINLEVSIPPSNPILSDLFYRFFRFFIYEHDFDVYAVSVTRSQFAKKADLGWPHLDREGRVVQENLIVIENPYERENLGRSISFKGLKRTRRAFQTACDLLRNGSPVEQLFTPFTIVKEEKTNVG